MQGGFLSGASNLRKWAVAAGICVGLANAVMLYVALGGRVHFLLSSRLPHALAVAVVSSACSAIILVELLRIAFPETQRWSDRKHFTIVATAWAILGAVQISGLLVFRQSVISH